MNLYNWSEVAEERLNPLFTRRMIHGQSLTVARLLIKKGAVVPLHSHHNEQISMIEEGSLRFFLGGEEKLVRAGQALHIPANLPHSAVADEDCVAIDIFSPPREDWIRGDDAYLRK